MTKIKFFLVFAAVVSFSACTQVVTLPISVAGSVVKAGIGVAGAAGGAVVDTVSGGDDEE